jgi:hypothetical protein
VTQQLDHALAHLARRLVGERDGEYVLRRNLALRDQVSDAMHDDARLTRPRARKDQERPLGRHDRRALLFV